ncbi:zinc-binding dehydrogenase [Nonomuraea sp. NPDC049309]|uniref:zinc-binding dehydrogenase n=1 Tax=Nonomuraea sp. NPDC049309 TaxID=3364350 RepID=UPI003714D27B
MVPDLEPGPGQVRIAVKAAGVHVIETVMRSGATGGIMPPLPELPTIFGGEVAGRVDAVGPDVDPSRLGRDVVISGGRPGGYAELAVADVTALHPLPEGMDHVTAAAMIVTGATTIHFLDVAALTAADAVLDGVGGDKGRAAFELPADGGRYVTIGNASRQDFWPSDEELSARGLTATSALELLHEHPDRRPGHQARALAAAADGTLVPAVQTFPLEQAAQAHAALESRRTTGKVVLIP